MTSTWTGKLVLLLTDIPDGPSTLVSRPGETPEAETSQGTAAPPKEKSMNPEIAEKLKRLDELGTKASSISASLSQRGSAVASGIAVEVARLAGRVSMMLMDLEKRQGQSEQSEEHENMLANMGSMIDGLQSMLDSLQSLVGKSLDKKR
jgi:hypothetical protein